MQYSVIYTVDTFGDESIAQYRPRAGHWTMTERDDRENEYGRRGKHRKFCAWLSQEEFDALIKQTYMYAEDVETLGSLGAPGFAGIAPAICFRAESDPYMQYGAMLMAYVTPVPSTSKRELNETDWQRIRRALLDKYHI